MSASPFRTTLKPYLEAAPPIAPAEMSDSKRLEDIPFESTLEEFPATETPEEHAKTPKQSWITRLFASRATKNRREEVLENELRDLRASYAGLLHNTEDIRERLDAEVEDRQSVQRALSPFPAAVAGLETIKSQQEEAGEILHTIRERIQTTADRDEALMNSLGFINTGVNEVQTEVVQVNKTISKVAQSQGSLSANLDTLGNNLSDQLEQVKSSGLKSQKQGERLEQSSDDVLNALQSMQASQQRSLWIFASLLAALFVILLCFTAKLNSFSAPTAEVTSEPTVAPAIVEQEVASDSEALVLQDDFQF